MKLRLTLIAAAICCLPTANAAVGYFGNFYVVSSLNGGSNVFNQIVSPANKYLYYPLGIAFQIIAVHQLRHIQQGKQVLQFFHDEIEP